MKREGGQRRRERLIDVHDRIEEPLPFRRADAEAIDMAAASRA